MSNNNIAILTTLLLLTGCAHYVPSVSNSPKNQLTLSADIAACEKDKEKRMAEAFKNHKSDAALMGGFGLAGAAIVHSNKDPEDDYFKTPKQMIDECMTAKGYKIKN